jgi:murein DD-endopeptidase MepM/ murein hydrolase activator NlpD
LDQRLALALAEMFAWQIDFATQIQKGDSFKVIYEKKYRGDSYDHPGKILAAEFINSGERFQGFYFNPVRDREGSQRASVSNGVKGDKTKEGYYDEAGNSLQKVFLKAPLQYKYVSSGFTYSRFNPILQAYTKHRGIDYAAVFGTPAVTVGDGTVVQAGWNGEYGISVKVRHNETYTTVYGHFSSLAKGIRIGAKVRQGQIIGYVGSTGLSTGPHLHYEMHKFGTFINPFKEKIPPGEPIKDGDLPAFQVVLDKYKKGLDKI